MGLMFGVIDKEGRVLQTFTMDEQSKEKLISKKDELKERFPECQIVFIGDPEEF